MRPRNFFLAVLFTASLQAQGTPKAVVPETDYHFPESLAGQVIEHDYVLRNEGDVPLRLQKADMTPPLRPTRLPATVEPGGEAVLRFLLDTSKVNSGAGPYEGQVVLYTNDPTQPEIGLTFQGKVVPPVEFDPFPAFFVSTVRDEPKTASIQILNHLPEPLNILRIDSPSRRFAVNLQTLEPGKRYRLDLTLPGEGAAGKNTDTITLFTSSEKHPVLKIAANIRIKERVYTAPEQLDFGLISEAKLQSNPKLLEQLTQTLMVYQAGGQDFQITVQTDVSFLRLSAARSPFQDRYQITVSVNPENLTFGPVSGSVTIATNDPEFPQVVVPVSAFVDAAR